MAAGKQIRFPEINFLPRDPFYDTAIGKASLWALRVGRYIIIFTEIIVIISFASRFKLDRDLTDLNSSIVQKTAVVQSYAETEKQVRLIQKKSDAIGKLIAQNDSLTAFNLLIGKIPFDIRLTRLGYTPEEILLNGVARSSVSFALFLAILQREPTFKQISIDEIATGDKRDPGIAFSLRLKLREKVTAPLTPQKAPAGQGTTGTLKPENNF